ncbi:arf-GAP with coiled-coil, ANK repeat and PH domain-containing protein 3-like isoform X2 [Actinia tenebrosa]|uniref:Arf-GAP with coiled-coil, ANK repeat and PH domain-containing protein 3-like isoform X2 n=1 Tax=Actinia tenebrosa TaxID=6105 RepID=A0A6P8J470_ACTTE|nr:arf-GAP with coiled-coil, ANK repeat and PH domain-containing protein 3-like isoform X2 [Actinia tenebrosa]
MTFYESEMVVPGLPRYEDVLIDSPSCHQSLKFWSQKADQIAPVLSELASNVEKYHGTGVKHQKSGLNISEALGNVVKVFQDDDKISEPITKFTDVLQRIECYRDMFLNQTQLLMWEPLVKLTQDYDKAKELNTEVLKAREAMHIAWEKFSSCPHVENLQEVGLLDKLAHSLLNARRNYQKVLLQYVTMLKEIHTLKKVVILQKVLEHMLAQFSFFNFGYQTLKDIEPYMNGLFQELQESHTKVEESLKKEVETQQEMEKEAVLQQQRDGQGFAEPSSAGIGQSVASMNTQAGKIFNKIGDLFQAGSFGLAGSRKSYKAPSSPSDQEWEVIESQRTSSKDKLSSEELSNKPSSSSSTPETKPKRTHDSGVKPSPKKEHHATGKAEEAGPTTKEAGQVVAVVPPELISPTTGNKETLSENLLPAPIASLQPPTTPSLNAYKGCKTGYLRIRQKAFPKNRWPLLYFIVDKENGNLLAQGQEQTQPSTLENLLLCTVKICDSEDADRNFCFQLISTTSERVFQALTNLEVQEWITAIQEATADALRNSKAKLKSLARSNLSDDIGHKREPRSLVLNAAERIRKVAGNKYCADCSSPRPDWASINIGITICIECSGVHRNMGVHVSKVRSLTLDKWEDTTVDFMEAMGNTKANQIYEGNLREYPKPTRDSSKDDRQKFIKLKYVEQRFYKALPSEDLDPEIAKVLASRPGESEEDLFDVSEEVGAGRYLMTKEN